MGPQGLGLEITELRLGLPGGSGDHSSGDGSKRIEKKRSISRIHEGTCGETKSRNMDLVVGWPPVCLYRKKSVCDAIKMYVKVSMDGAPFLRKVDLSCFKGYLELGMALEKLFDCYGIGKAMKEESDGCEYIAIYEDKDGDWMLVGDVPWLMFTDTCKRLRIKNKTDTGLHLNDTMNEG